MLHIWLSFLLSISQDANVPPYSDPHWLFLFVSTFTSGVIGVVTWLLMVSAPLHFINELMVDSDVMLLQESTEAMLNLSCTECGKPCRSQMEVDLHKKRTGHENYVDKVLPNLNYDRLLHASPFGSVYNEFEPFRTSNWCLG